MICFFDPAHGNATVNVMWMPQWGVQRPIEVCQFCAQRIQTTQPPFYTPQQQGYPQQGYPQQGGFYGNQQDQWGQNQGRPQGQGHSTGAMIGAGAAGLVGGMVLGEMLSDDDDDRRDYREERDDFGGGDDDGGFGDFF
jgi:hypothetical protein